MRIPIKTYRGILDDIGRGEWAYWTDIRIYTLTGNKEEAIKQAEAVDKAEDKERQGETPNT